MDMLKRILTLEKAITTEEWPDAEIHIIEIDASEAGRGKPGRLSIVIKSGTPDRPGKSYCRGESETEEAFLERIKAAELVRLG